MSFWSRIGDRLESLATDVFTDERDVRISQALKTAESDPEQGRRLLHALISENPSDIETILITVNQERIHSHQNARATLREAIRHNPQEFSLYLADGYEALAEADTANAAASFYKAITLAPPRKKNAAWMGLAESTLLQCDGPTALWAVEQLRKPTITDPDYRGVLGIAQVLSKQTTPDTEKHLLFAINNPSNWSQKARYALSCIGRSHTPPKIMESHGDALDCALLTQAFTFHGAYDKAATVALHLAEQTKSPGHWEAALQLQQKRTNGTTKTLEKTIAALPVGPQKDHAFFDAFEKGRLSREFVAQWASEREDRSKTSFGVTGTLIEKLELLREQDPEAIKNTIAVLLQKNVPGVAAYCLFHKDAGYTWEQAYQAAIQSPKQTLSAMAEKWSCPANEGSFEQVLTYANAVPLFDHKKLTRWQKRLGEPLTIVLAGGFSTGKSSFINRLLGRDILPVGITPTTGQLLTIRWGEQEQVTLADGTIIPLEERALWEPMIQGQSATFEIAHPLLRSLRFVDTPGLNAVHPEHGEITRSHWQQAEMIFWFFAAQQVGSKLEKHWLEMLAQLGIPIQGIVGKSDTLTPVEQSTVKEFLEKELNGTLAGVFLSHHQSPNPAQEWVETELGPHAAQEKARSSSRQFGTHVGVVLKDIEDQYDQLLEQQKTWHSQYEELIKRYLQSIHPLIGHFRDQVQRICETETRNQNSIWSLISNEELSNTSNQKLAGSVAESLVSTLRESAQYFIRACKQELLHLDIPIARQNLPSYHHALEKNLEQVLTSLLLVLPDEWLSTGTFWASVNQYFFAPFAQSVGQAIALFESSPELNQAEKERMWLQDVTLPVIRSFFTYVQDSNENNNRN